MIWDYLDLENPEASRILILAGLSLVGYFNGAVLKKRMWASSPLWLAESYSNTTYSILRPAFTTHPEGKVLSGPAWQSASTMRMAAFKGSTFGGNKQDALWWKRTGQRSNPSGNLGRHQRQ